LNNKGLYSAGEVYRRAAEMGLDCKRNNFLVAIRNPVYCGRIFIVKFKDEDAHTVKGMHEGIISESLFYDVQDVLNGNRKAEKTKVHSPDMLPLRGFIRCSKCSRMLCGSASKGRNGYYYYYHCSSACGCRYKAEEVNELFVSQLEHYTIEPGYAELFTEVISDTYNNQFSGQRDNRSDLLKEINKLSDKLSRARELLLSGDIDGTDYRTIKKENETKIEILEARLAETMAIKTQFEDIKPLVTKAISRLTQLNAIY
jgi:hypothetical protein